MEDRFSRPKKEYRKNNAPIEDENTEDSGLIYGRNAVSEALKGGRTVNRLFVRSGEREGSLPVILALAAKAGVPIVEVTKEKLDAMTDRGAHQGVAASVAAVEYVDVDRLFEISVERGEPPFFVICDGVEDPHNLGAIIRCAEGAGAHGVIIGKRHGALVTPTVVKASAGAIEHMAICRVVNIASTIDALKERGVWIYGAEADGNDLYSSDLTGAAAFVVGSEGKGMSRLVREKCDFVLSIPMYGRVNSFNVSCASAVILCAAANARHNK